MLYDTYRYSFRRGRYCSLGGDVVDLGVTRYICDLPR